MKTGKQNVVSAARSFNVCVSKGKTRYLDATSTEPDDADNYNEYDEADGGTQHDAPVNCANDAKCGDPGGGGNKNR